MGLRMELRNTGRRPAPALLPLLLVLALAACRPAQQEARQEVRQEAQAEHPAPAPGPQPRRVDGAGQAGPLLGIGRPFPPFMLDFIAPGAAREALRGKTVVLNIWASWCPPCRREMPGLDQLSRRLDPRRFVVLGLSTDDDAAAAAEFVTQSGIGFANFLDQGGNVTRRLGTDAYPVTFVIAPDGTLLQFLEGYQDWTSPAMLTRLQALAAPASGQGRGAAPAPQSSPLAAAAAHPARGLGI